MLTQSELKSIGVAPMYHENVSVLDWDSYFMQMAELASQRSPDASTKHGCVIVKNRSILVTGYNGYPSGCPDEIMPNTREKGYKYKFIVHSETNAILQAAKRGVALAGATLYVTGMPCEECSKQLISVGVTNWVVGSRTHTQDEESALRSRFWREVGKVVVKHHNSDYQRVIQVGTDVNGIALFSSSRDDYQTVFYAAERPKKTKEIFTSAPMPVQPILKEFGGQSRPYR